MVPGAQWSQTRPRCQRQLRPRKVPVEPSAFAGSTLTSPGDTTFFSSGTPRSRRVGLQPRNLPDDLGPSRVDSARTVPSGTGSQESLAVSCAPTPPGPGLPERQDPVSTWSGRGAFGWQGAGSRCSDAVGTAGLETQAPPETPAAWLTPGRAQGGADCPGTCGIHCSARPEARTQGEPHLATFPR